MARHDFDPATVAPDGRLPGKARLFDGTLDGPRRGSVNGETIATQVTVLASAMTNPGSGRSFTSTRMTRSLWFRKAEPGSSSETK